jgi:signal peptidase II
MNRRIFSIAVFSLLFDQITKVIVNTLLNVNEKLVIIKNFFAIYFVENEGAAWSILSNKQGLLILASILALIIIYRYMYNFKNNRRNNLAFGLIIGGIFGNLIDRLFLGYVRDFLSIQIINYYYPIFNFADSFIVIGVVLLIIAIFKGEEDNAKNKSRNR